MHLRQGHHLPCLGQMLAMSQSNRRTIPTISALGKTPSPILIPLHSKLCTTIQTHQHLKPAITRPTLTLQTQLNRLPSNLAEKAITQMVRKAPSSVVVAENTATRYHHQIFLPDDVCSASLLTPHCLASDAPKRSLRSVKN